jgi:D-methionine transport system substrate-binding protein
VVIHVRAKPHLVKGISMSTTPQDSTDPGSTPALPDKPKKSRGFLIGIVVAAVVVLVGAAVLVVNLTRSDTAADRVTVKIGTTEASADYWPILINLAAEQGIDIQTVNFGDYTQANPALSQGQLDLNLFQHLLYLASFNVSTGDTLTPIGSTVVVPLGLYSEKHATIDDIPQGGQVAIPNDPTNQARALLVLQQAGLIALKDGGNVLSTPAEIDQANSKVTVTPVDAKQTVTSLASVDAAIINNNFALDAKLDPSKALYNDDPSKPAAQPYINAFVAREADKDNPTYLKIAELYQDPAVTKAVVDASQGTAVIVNRPAPELQSILSGLEDTVRAAQ